MRTTLRWPIATRSDRLAPRLSLECRGGLGRGACFGLYLRAMDAGEVFFIATGTIDGERLVLGFASDYLIDGGRHGTSAYVRGTAARCGIGSQLLVLAQAHAVANGATEIHVEASLAGVEFYRANGFVETGRGETRLTSGRPSPACSCGRVLWHRSPFDLG